MRIAFVTHGYPRWDGDIAGAFIEHLAVALVARGHDVLVLAPADGGRGGEEERHGVSVRRIRYAAARSETLAYRGTMVQSVRSPRGFVTAFRLTRALVQAIRRARQLDQVELVHAHWWVPGGVAAWRAGSGPYVVTVHGTDAMLLESSWVGRVIARRVFRHASAITTVSSFLSQRVSRVAGRLADEVPVQPMPLALPVGPLAEGGGGIVTVGRLTAQKRIHLVLEAVAELTRSGSDLSLTIVGDGPERRTLAERAGALGISSRTTFTGMVAPDRLPTLLATADVMAFPAQAEGFGLAAAEALALGVPVVAFADGGGLLDVVPTQRGGRLVPAGDVRSLAGALATLATHPAERQGARAQGEQLRRRLAPDAVAQVFESVYARAGGAGAASRQATSVGSTAAEK